MRLPIEPHRSGIITLANGTEHRHETRSHGAAENWATRERRNIGKTLLCRWTGEKIITESVRIEALR